MPAKQTTKSVPQVEEEFLDIEVDIDLNTDDVVKPDQTTAKVTGKRKSVEEVAKQVAKKPVAVKSNVESQNKKTAQKPVAKKPKVETEESEVDDENIPDPEDDSDDDSENGEYEDEEDESSDDEEEEEEEHDQEVQDFMDEYQCVNCLGYGESDLEDLNRLKKEIAKKTGVKKSEERDHLCDCSHVTYNEWEGHLKSILLSLKDEQDFENARQILDHLQQQMKEKNFKRLRVEV
jgi:hypothetical protein